MRSLTIADNGALLYALFAVSCTVALACVGCAQMHETVRVLRIVVIEVCCLCCYVHCYSGVHCDVNMFGLACLAACMIFSHALEMWSWTYYFRVGFGNEDLLCDTMDA